MQGRSYASLQTTCVGKTSRSKHAFKAFQFWISLETRSNNNETTSQLFFISCTIIAYLFHDLITKMRHHCFLPMRAIHDVIAARILKVSTVVISNLYWVTHCWKSDWHTYKQTKDKLHIKQRTKIEVSLDFFLWSYKDNHQEYPSLKAGNNKMVHGHHHHHHSHSHAIPIGMTGAAVMPGVPIYPQAPVVIHDHHHHGHHHGLGHAIGHAIGHAVTGTRHHNHTVVIPPPVYVPPPVHHVHAAPAVHIPPAYPVGVCPPSSGVVHGAPIHGQPCAPTAPVYYPHHH
jgi:hypothetical protein